MHTNLSPPSYATPWHGGRSVSCWFTGEGEGEAVGSVDGEGEGSVDGEGSGEAVGSVDGERDGDTGGWVSDGGVPGTVVPWTAAMSAASLVAIRNASRLQWRWV